MTAQDSRAGAGAEPSVVPSTVADLDITRLTRDSANAPIAGVCATIAQQFDLDPVLVRVLMAFAALCGGTGLAIYVACALMWPDKGHQYSRLDAVLPASRHWTDRTRAVAVGIVALVTGWSFSALTPFDLSPIVVCVIAWVIASRQNSRRAAAGTLTWSQYYLPTPTTPEGLSFQTALDAWQARLAQVSSGDPATQIAPPLPLAPGAAVQERDLWTRPVVATARARRPRRRKGPTAWVLTIGTLVAAAAAGVLLWQLLPATLDTAMIGLASTVLVLALGLAIGAFTSRTRLLVPVGIIMALVMGGAIVARVDPPQQSSYWYAQQSDLPGEQLQIRHANASIDLTGLAGSAAGADLQVRAQASRLRITLPDGVPVKVVYRTALSQIQLPGDPPVEPIGSGSWESEPGAADPLLIELVADLSEVVVSP